MAGFSELQRLGKALMLPIAVLPAAGLLLRLGAPDVLDIPVMTKAGGAVFDNLAAIFAAGIAVGFSKDAAGAAGLAGLVGYYVMTTGMKAINADINMGVLAGIITGVTAGLLYNRFYRIKLPDYLGFFGGKRFVPIITGGVCFLLAVLFGFIWPPIQAVIEAIGNWIVTSGSIGAFVYGTLNRLLIPLGLHHILNSLVWFVFGSYPKPDGTIATGDLNRFFAGDPTAGTFMAGFYPVMMFGLPAACIAMAHMARPENRRVTSGVMLSMALTSFLTGITEPIEFTFMFLAPVLYAVHAVLTGISLALLDILGIKHGFTFSAGAIDFVLNLGLSTQGWLILPIGLVYFAIYYFLFRFMIRALNLQTPGREAGTVVEADSATSLQDTPSPGMAASNDTTQLARRYLAALGGHENIKTIDSCITRLRLTMVNRDLVSDDALKSLGAKGVIRAGADGMQVILGPLAESVAEEMKNLRDMAPTVGTSNMGTPITNRAATGDTIAIVDKPASVTQTDLAQTDLAQTGATQFAHRYIAALGGRDNIKSIDANGTKLRVVLTNRDLVSESQIIALGAVGMARPGSQVVQIFLEQQADSIAAAMKKIVD
ncbi:MAG: PTS transporter subunit EIIC [Elainella sp. C42_A2020_010]|nr:PTS transporter subunit EIIC [Elainella sp. C42_A2020_010]